MTPDLLSAVGEDRREIWELKERRVWGDSMQGCLGRECCCSSPRWMAKELRVGGVSELAVCVGVPGGGRVRWQFGVPLGYGRDLGWRDSFRSMGDMWG